MIHGDNKGLVLPPKAANIQAVIVPCGITAKTTDAERRKLIDAVEDLEHDLKKQGIRAYADTRESYSPGYKFNDWELKGVPLRLEYGPKDMEKKQVVSVRRDTGAKAPIAIEGLGQTLNTLLETIHEDMYNKAKKLFDDNVELLHDWEKVTPALDNKKLVLLPHCDVEECEEEIKEDSKGRVDEDSPEDSRAPSMGAKSLCIPFEQPTGKDAFQQGVTKCVKCGENAKHYTLFGRSY